VMDSPFLDPSIQTSHRRRYLFDILPTFTTLTLTFLFSVDHYCYSLLPFIFFNIQRTRWDGVYSDFSFLLSLSPKNLSFHVRSISTCFFSISTYASTPSYIPLLSQSPCDYPSSLPAMTAGINRKP